MTISLLPTSTFIKIVVSECVEASLCIELPGYPLLTFLPVMCVQPAHSQPTSTATPNTHHHVSGTRRPRQDRRQARPRAGEGGPGLDRDHPRPQAGGALRGRHPRRPGAVRAHEQAQARRRAQDQLLRRPVQDDGEHQQLPEGHEGVRCLRRGRLPDRRPLGEEQGLRLSHQLPLRPGP